MAHRLSFVSGQAEMMFVRETPWHGLGTKLDKPATAKEAIEAAHMDWEVELRPVFFTTTLKDGSESTMRPFPSRMAAVRAIPGKDPIPLGVVSSDYKAIQNREAFSFFDAIVGEGEAIYETAGAIDDGRQVFILAKLPNDTVIDVDHADVTNQYLLLASSHDGSKALRMFYTPTRVCCFNTLNMALSHMDLEQTVTIRHSGNLQDKISEAQRILGLATAYYQKFGEQANWLARIEAKPELVQTFLLELLPKPEEAGRALKRRDENAGLVTSLFERERGRSCWHLYNAAVEFADHFGHYKSEVRGRSVSVASSRFKSVIFGSRAQIKSQAAKSIVALAAAI